MNPPAPKGYAAWWWRRFLAELDRAGYAIVKKPRAASSADAKRRA
jgi:hypothetical protein